jgi:exopolysaccharide production protein ExoQ
MVTATHTTIGRERSAQAWPMGVGLRGLLLDVFWIIFLFGASSAPHPLGIQNVEGPFWFAGYLAVVAAVLVDKGGFLRLVKKHAIFLTWPILACMSTIWSLTPWMSIYHGIQLFMTIMVGLLLCYHASLQRILQLLFAALLVCAVLSLPYAIIKAQTGGWQGLFPHKNVLGHMMCLLLITGLCLFLSGWRPLLSAAAMFLALVCLFMTRSGTSFIALFAALAILPVIVSMRRGSVWFATFLGLTVVGIATFLLVLELMDINLVRVILDALGKDETLTGRTVLWEFGMEALHDRPWLGHGYKAYWDSPVTSALLLRTVIGQELWFFHNNFLDVGVAFGFVGIILLSAVLLIAFFVTVRKSVTSWEYAALWPPVYIVFVLVLSTAENPLFQNHSLHQLLFIVAVAGSVQYGSRPQRPREPGF